MQNTFAKIEVNMCSDTLSLKLNNNGRQNWYKKKVIYKNKFVNDHLLFFWVLNCLKTIFFEMPFVEIKKIQYGAILGNYENKYERLVRTASAWQVRQPLYNTSVARWKNYAQFLEPLKKALNSDVKMLKYFADRNQNQIS